MATLQGFSYCMIYNNTRLGIYQIFFKKDSSKIPFDFIKGYTLRWGDLFQTSLYNNDVVYKGFV